MILRRFGNWMRSWLARHPGGDRAEGREHEAVLIGAAYRSAVAGQVAPSPLVSWLDDAHRLRPHLRLAVAIPDLPVRQRGRTPQPLRAEAAPSPAPEQQVATPPADRHDCQVVTAEPPALTPPTLTPPALTPPALTPNEAHPVVDAELDGLEGMDAERRRLVLLRYLVHQRVYNEGFGRGETPDQYRPRSPQPKGERPA